MFFFFFPESMRKQGFGLWREGDTTNERQGAKKGQNNYQSDLTESNTRLGQVEPSRLDPTLAVSRCESGF